uniref:Uncharacterized protein n=1 Tax=Biomphalaria glabrata TaxID=6526 RepID=A0A2C9M6F2_BIOGL
MGFWKKAVSGVSAASICGMGYIAYDVKRHKVYSNQTFAEAAKHYFTVRSLYVMGKLMARKLEAATKDIKTAQKEFLLQQLKENKDTQFFQDMQVEKLKHEKMLDSYYGGFFFGG